MDMATYVRMLLNRGQGPRERILSEQSFQQMIQRLIAPPIEDEGHGGFYGYGLLIDVDEGHTIIGHDGGMVGYYASILADLDDGLGVVVLMNGPGDPTEIARFALKLLRASTAAQELPPLPPAPEPQRVDNPSEFAGTYRMASGAFTIVMQNEGLGLVRNGEQLALERRGKDRFYVPHPDFSRFLLRFGREEGKVVEALLVDKAEVPCKPHEPKGYFLAVNGGAL